MSMKCVINEVVFHTECESDLHFLTIPICQTVEIFLIKFFFLKNRNVSE